MSDYDLIRGNTHQAEAGLTNRFSGGKQSFASVITALESTLISVGVDEVLTLYWIALNTPETNKEEVEVQVRLGIEDMVYCWFLGVPGAFMHWEPISGAPGRSLVLIKPNLEPLAVNLTYTISNATEEEIEAVELFPSETLYPSEELIPA